MRLVPEGFRTFGLSLATLAALLIAWQVVAVLRASLFLPPPTRVAGRLVSMATGGELTQAVGYTLYHMLVGYLLSAVVMIVLGIMLASTPRLYAALRATIEFLRPLPVPTIVPAAILFFGIGSRMVLIVVCFGTIWPILVHTVAGARSVHPSLVETARLLRMSKWEFRRKILLPSALPEIFTGLKISLPIALVISLLAEMISASPGLGYQLLLDERAFKVPEMLATAAVVGMLGAAINALFDIGDRRLLRWHYRLS